MMRRLVWVVPLMLLLPAGGAVAQVSGSYQNSCTDIAQNGSTLIARCRGPNGTYDTTLDLDRCGNIGVANSGGRLTCGNQRGSARLARDGGGYGRGDEDSGYQRRRRYDDGNGRQPDYGYSNRPRYADPDDSGYAPRRRYYNPDQY